MKNWIGKKIKVDGFSITDYNLINRDFVVADIEDDIVLTKCGHKIEQSSDRTIYNKNNRRVMLEARIDWDNAK
jgi:hypothetical protein